MSSPKPRPLALLPLILLTACGSSGIDALPDCLVALDGVCTLERDRTATQVCDRVAADHPVTVDDDDVWTPGDEPCDPGELNPAAHADALRRANLYRWLARQPPAESVAEYDDASQQCALMQSMAGALNHFPPDDWACFSEAGADAASRANLSLGRESPAEDISGLIADRGDNNMFKLGHRRWVLHPSTTRVGFGHAQADRGATCMLVVDPETPSYEQPVTMDAPISFPSPGAYPLELVDDGGDALRWSVTAEGLAAVALSVWRESASGLEEVPHTWGLLEPLLEDGVWIAPEEPPSPGRYLIELKGPQGNLGIRTDLVSCL